jgi:hypothetical protein
MNLFESGGARVRNTGPENSQTALEAAAAAGVGVLINRPLNAFAGNRLLRLASPTIPPQGTTLEAATATLRALELEHRNGIAPRVDRTAADAAGQLFQLVEQLVEMAPQVEDLVHWRQIEQQYVIPRVNYVAGAVARGIDEGQKSRWQSWWGHFSSALHARRRRRAAGRRRRSPPPSIPRCRPSVARKACRAKRCGCWGARRE